MLEEKSVDIKKGKKKRINGMQKPGKGKFAFHLSSAQPLKEIK
jgi:hypothetical protein